MSARTIANYAKLVDEQCKVKAHRPKWGEPGSKTKRTTGATVFSQGKRRPVIVTIYPDGVIGLRLSKHRKEEFVNADDLYRQAVLTRVANARAAKKKARKK